MVAWHQWLNGHGFGSTLGVGDGQGGLVCCSPWVCKESDMSEWLNWTELKLLCIYIYIYLYRYIYTFMWSHMHVYTQMVWKSWVHTDTANLEHTLFITTQCLVYTSAIAGGKSKGQDRTQSDFKNFASAVLITALHLLLKISPPILEATLCVHDSTPFFIHIWAPLLVRL